MMAQSGKAPELHVLIAADGALVYPNRWTWCPAVFLGIAAALCCTAPSLKVFLVSIVPMYLTYDFYSGVLHVALDDPRNMSGIKSFILFQGCLEFQWHHAIPYETRAEKASVVLRTSATLFREDGSRRRRGCDADIPCR